MTIQEAQIIVDRFHRNNGNYTEEEFFLYTEAAGFLIHETKDSEIMLNLGGYYYDQKRYELALKYYEMAMAHGNGDAAIGLGYIWYYGRTGTVDYEKAFHYFSMKEEYYPIAKIKVADMYHNGYFVEKNEAKYKEIIEELYRIYHNSNFFEDPLPEIYIRLAGIREREGDIPEAKRLLREGKSELSAHIGFYQFFGYYSMMHGLIRDLYRLTPLDRNNFDLYDLYEVFTEPVTVSFSFKGKTYTIESSREEDGSIAVCFNGKWYRSIGDMLMQAELDGYHITLSPWKMKDFTIIS
ncbi:MAG: sel1 repeat family protein [Oscillospiraceae bacterium]|nr:sel1 repeat family protein [Oscillospiraceae bacterium]